MASLEIAVGGDAQAVARAAEMVAHGRDEADLAAETGHLPRLHAFMSQTTHMACACTLDVSCASLGSAANAGYLARITSSISL